MFKGFKTIVLLGLLLWVQSGVASAIEHQPPAVPYDPNQQTVQRSDAQWKKLLTADQYHILREQGTEKAYSGKYDKFYEPGLYICAACGQPLYSSKTKYDSQTGWPSFYQPLTPKSVATREDNLLFFIKRTEVYCPRCGGHLGHVFDDGPEPTGLRYCMNSKALTFIPEDQIPQIYSQP